MKKYLFSIILSLFAVASFAQSTTCDTCVIGFSDAKFRPAAQNGGAKIQAEDIRSAFQKTDKKIQTKVGELNTQLQLKASQSTLSDSLLQIRSDLATKSALIAEQNARIAADNTINANISSKVSQTTLDNVLLDYVDINAKNDMVNNIYGDINAEIAARIAADEAINTSLSNKAGLNALQTLSWDDYDKRLTISNGNTITIPIPEPVNMSNYYTQTQTNSAINSNVQTALGQYMTSVQTQSALLSKADTAALKQEIYNRQQAVLGEQTARQTAITNVTNSIAKEITANINDVGGSFEAAVNLQSSSQVSVKLNWTSGSAPFEYTVTSIFGIVNGGSYYFKLPQTSGTVIHFPSNVFDEYGDLMTNYSAEGLPVLHFVAFSGSLYRVK